MDDIFGDSLENDFYVRLTGSFDLLVRDNPAGGDSEVREARNLEELFIKVSSPRLDLVRDLEGVGKGIGELVCLLGKWQLNVILPVDLWTNVVNDVKFFLEEFVLESGSWGWHPLDRTSSRDESDRLISMFKAPSVSSERCIVVKVTAANSGALAPFPCTSVRRKRSLTLFRFVARYNLEEVHSGPLVVVLDGLKDQSKWEAHYTESVNQAIMMLKSLGLAKETLAAEKRGEESPDVPKSTKEKRRKITRKRTTRESDEEREGDEYDEGEDEDTRLSNEAFADSLYGCMKAVLQGQGPDDVLARKLVRELKRFCSGKGDLAYRYCKLDPDETLEPCRVVALVATSSGPRATLMPPQEDVGLFAWTVIADEGGKSGGPSPWLVANPEQVAEANSVSVVYLGHALVYVDHDVRSGDTLFAGTRPGVASKRGKHRLGVCLEEPSCGKARCLINVLGMNIAGDGVLEALNSLGRAASVYDQSELKVFLDEFIAKAVKSEYETFRVRFFCHPLRSVVFDSVIPGDSTKREIWQLLLDHKRVLLRGDCGVGKTITLKSLCFDHHLRSANSYFNSDDVLLYVDLTLLSSLSLDEIVMTCFPHAAREGLASRETLVRTFELWRSRIIYFFDGYDLVAQDGSVARLLRENRLPWLGRHVIALRKESQFISSNEPEVDMKGLHSDAERNLFVSLIVEEKSKQQDALKFLSTNPSLNSLSYNPFFCDLLLGAWERGDLKGKRTVTLRNILGSVLDQWSYRAGDQTQEQVAVEDRERELSSNARMLLEILAVKSLQGYDIALGKDFLEATLESMNVGKKKAKKLLSGKVRAEVRRSGILVKIIASDNASAASRFKFLHPLLEDFLAATLFITKKKMFKTLRRDLLTPRLVLKGFLSFLIEADPGVGKKILKRFKGNSEELIVCLALFRSEEYFQERGVLARYLTMATSEHWLRASCVSRNLFALRLVMEKFGASLCRSEKLRWIAQEACMEGYVPVLETMLPFIQPVVPSFQQVLLEWSLRFNHVDCARFLVFCANANITKLAKDVGDFVDFACRVPTLRFLHDELKFNLDTEFKYYPPGASDGEWQTFLWFALDNRRFDIVKYFIEIDREKVVPVAIEYGEVACDAVLLQFLIDWCDVPSNVIYRVEDYEEALPEVKTHPRSIYRSLNDIVKERYEACSK